MDFLRKYVREAQHYSSEELKNFFCLDEKIKFQEFVKTLISHHFLTYKKYKVDDGGKLDYSVDDDEGDEEHFYCTIKNDDFMDENVRFRFTFVGIIVYKNIVIYSYPKYLIPPAGKKEYEPKKELYQVLRVIERYHWDKHKDSIQSVDLLDEFNENEEADNTLPMIFFILQDYVEHGLYEKDETILETNGSGEVYWQKTVDETFPIISDGEPYYVNTFTRKNEVDDLNFIRRLHAYIVALCSNEMQSVGLDYFMDLPCEDLVVDDSGEFEDADYVAYRLRQEIGSVFEDRKLHLLRVLYAYIKRYKPIHSNDNIQIVGTNSFNLVWEWVCAKVFQSQKDKKITELDLLKDLDYKQFPEKFGKPPTLVELIEKPFWQVVDSYGVKREARAGRTLTPDHLRFQKTEDAQFIFYILDAKYYCPLYRKDKENKDIIVKQPGVADIVKQYMYYAFYQSFFAVNHINCDIRNYFILPRPSDEKIVEGYVKFDFLNIKHLKWGNIDLEFMEPKDVYDTYLNGGVFPLSELSKEFMLEDLKSFEDVENKPDRIPAGFEQDKVDISHTKVDEEQEGNNVIELPQPMAEVADNKNSHVKDEEKEHSNTPYKERKK